MVEEKLNILSLSGFRGSGKDTVCDYLKTLDDSIIRFSWADELKKEVHGIFNIPLAKLHAPDYIKTNTKTSLNTKDLISANEIIFNSKRHNIKEFKESLTVREVLQLWGTEIRRYNDKDCWIKKFNIISGNVVITDTRFKNELDFVKKNKGKSIWLMSESKNDTHKSEQDMSKYCDIKIPANGIELKEITFELAKSFATEVGVL
jgi:hypothetical protein